MNASAKDEKTKVATAADRIVGAVIMLGLFLALWYGFGWWTSSRVIGNAVERYEIVKRGGDAKAVCLEARNVVAAQLYAKKEDEWRRWKDIEATDCRAY